MGAYSGVAAPELDAEPLEIRTQDGVSLAATVLEPREAAHGTVVMAHAMFARQTAFRRPNGRGVAELFRDRGWRVVTFDFRGHGASAQCNGYGYDDFVARDLPAVVECVRSREDGIVALLGHSLGGHVALASHGSELVKLDAIVLVAANVWLRAFEPSAAMWIAKRAMMDGFVRLARRVGHFPARALRMGSDDESLAYVEDLARTVIAGRWASRDGMRDYTAALENVVIPVYSIASDGDRINARPIAVEQMLARCRGPIHIDHVRKSDDGSRAPGHGAILTSLRARSAFVRAEEFLRTL